MKTIPTVQKYMTVLPHTIGADQSLSKAEKMMSELRVRHLPVLDGGKLVGILTDRDVRLVESFRDVDPEKVSVQEAYTPDPFVTSPNTPLNQVCSEMAAHKFGCALVVDNHKLVGIFTWVDALKAMDHLMETRLKH
ncbi:MAG TPA: CBS domain-containing protein [Pseudobdellovibrionaceae bacterium]|nr:CBS domain-containing protein [Pseudobdellovibrionaceae bacterium]